MPVLLAWLTQIVLLGRTMSPELPFWGKGAFGSDTWGHRPRWQVSEIVFRVWKASGKWTHDNCHTDQKNPTDVWSLELKMRVTKAIWSSIKSIGVHEQECPPQGIQNQDSHSLYSSQGGTEQDIEEATNKNLNVHHTLRIEQNWWVG
jgi:hypothetical protein